MAVRAHPRLKLRFKSIKDQAPCYKRRTGHGSRIRLEAANVLPRSLLFSMDDWEMAAALPMKSRPIIKKIGFLNSD